MTGEVGWVYTLHFDKRIGLDGRNGALHYVGWARNLQARLANHAAANGRGAALTDWAVSHGIGWTLADTRPGTRADERRLKRNGHHDQRCSICSGKDG